ncbi:CPBP family intramembrane glutamic endopeptidase [Enterobacter ludwigii]|uniref:CPBP family intramembrane glutamic endopeptidase n=1 Tax=Enterobacter ludwigii TaxID=299767 RepID=UPI0029535EC3|nr:CPBP family intramembrane glutamic endopeptidase [Enterobacter ludwigii]MDV8142612.1 CPBP family intramembrane glutamic endopeptidase [Enterobacter ludwigii]
MNERTGQVIYSKQSSIVFLIVVVISTVVTLSPAFMLRYVGLDTAFTIIFITEILISTFVYFFYLKKIPGCIIKMSGSPASVKFSVFSFLIIIFIQLTVYCYRNYLYHYEPSQINWITVIVMTLVVPYYEEIIYRGCAFEVACSIYRKNLVIPCVITSLFFCLMHGQYYNMLDQMILFVVSMLLFAVKIKSRSLFYPILIHSSMNAFVILLNIQSVL